MLTLTDNAIDVVKTLTEQAGEPAEAGLRISQQPREADGTEPSLALAPAEHPHPGDQVVEAGGARLFLDSPAAAALDEQTLDAAVDEAGRVSFAVAPQA